MRHMGWTLVAIVVVFLAALYIDLPGTTDFLGRPVALNKGIDINGGLRALMCAKGGIPTSADMETARNVINSRVAGGLGVAEPQVSRVGARCIDVELPGLKDQNQSAVIKTIGATGFFAITDSGSRQLGSGAKVKLACNGGPALGCPPNSKPGVTNTTGTVPTLKVIAAGKFVSSGSAQVGFGTDGRPSVTYTLYGAGADAWCNFTTNNVGRFSAIVLDNVVISDPTINQPICGGRTQITGIASTEEAKRIATALNYGALPVPLRLDSSEQVSASLGSQYVRQATIAGIVGLIIVALFMLLYYRLPGLLADVALLLYAIVVFALFKLIGVTLTLAGIAGFILSIGMAVDANVLIFERMKEELRSGKTLGSAVESGFRRAFPSIRDSNMSTIITTIILFWFGRNFAATVITGFATTLFLGVVISFITAYFVSHTFLRLVVLSGSAGNPSLYGIERPTPASGGSVA